MLHRLRIATFLGMLFAIGNLGACDDGSDLHGYTVDDLERELSDRLELQDIDLTPAGDSSFAGSGVDAEGRTYEIDGTYDHASASWRATYRSLDGMEFKLRTGTISETTAGDRD